MNPQMPASAPEQSVTLYADGAAAPNPGRGGYGVVLLHAGQRREFSGGFRKTTNNRMEIMGVLIGLRALNGQKSKVTVVSDSKYVVDMFTGGYAEQWRRARWTRNKGKDAARNPDLWNELLNLAAQHEVSFRWVRGHGSNLDNARCDELAVAARGGRDLPADAGYEQPFVPGQPAQLTLFPGPADRGYSSGD
jgi:ribonuclease HI